MSKISCRACHSQIDDAAKLCPYCGANPQTGVRNDPSVLLEKEFTRREEVSGSEAILEFVRKRQGLVVGLVVAGVFMLAFGLHQFITVRNSREVADIPAIPLTEVADLSGRPNEARELPLPDLKFQYDGNPQALKTFVIEPGAVAPPPPPPESTPSTVSTPASISAPKPGGTIQISRSQGNQPPATQKPPTPPPPASSTSPPPSQPRR